MLSTLEKVVALQEIEVFQNLTTDDLIYIASIADECSFDADDVIFNQDGVPDSMYVVLEGRVRLHQGAAEVTVAGISDAFGTWAHFDDEPRVMTATAAENCRLLRIEKDDFVDLLADNINITQGIMKALVRRVRRLMILVSGRTPSAIK